jgi:hypothetical protein
LGLKAYRPLFVNKLNDADMQKIYGACEQLLRVFESIPALGEVVFPDGYTYTEAPKA